MPGCQRNTHESHGTPGQKKESVPPCEGSERVVRGVVATPRFKIEAASAIEAGIDPVELAGVDSPNDDQ